MSNSKFWEMIKAAYDMVATENGRVVKFQHDTHEATVYHRSTTNPFNGSGNVLGQIIIEISEVNKLPGQPLIAPAKSHRKDYDG